VKLIGAGLGKGSRSGQNRCRCSRH
jgi:hypothetical protein